MRKIIVLEFITLDGVIQAPGGRKEDTSEDFEYGGWTAPFSDDVMNNVLQDQMEPADLLLGRTTFDLWENYWPKHADIWPGINEVTKYVVGTTKKKTDWNNTTFLSSIEDVKKLKETDGGDIKIWGSSLLVQSLLKEDLVDELWLKIFPVTLGQGKKLFKDGIKPSTWKLQKTSVISPSGVILANYERAGDVKTGDVGE